MLLAPFLLFFLVFWLAPLAGGIRLSLMSDDLYGASQWVGLEHYRNLWGDERYAHALRNTALYTVCGLVAILPLALVLAQAIRMVFARARPVLTFCLLLPGLTPPAVLALLFLLVFHGREGLLNQWFVIPFGGTPINWLKDPGFILPAMVLQAIWRWTGFITFFFLAGMEAIPRVYHEAAHLDCNSRWRVFFLVTVPQLRPVILFAAVYLAVDAFSLFAGSYVLLGGSGGTADAGLLLVTYTYQTAFTFGKFGTAAAMGLSVAPVLLGLLWLCFAWPRRMNV